MAKVNSVTNRPEYLYRVWENLWQFKLGTTNHSEYIPVFADNVLSLCIECLQNNHAMVVVHHSATAIIEYAKIARKQHLHSVCLDSLSKIHSIPSVPVLDCFQKIRQQVRTHD